MITVRKSEARGAANHGCLDTKHSFSFGDYLDRTQMNFRSRRVLNEDIVAPEMGFPLHPHKNAEILTYIVSGELTHTDSLGHREIIKRGDVQYTNAGSGIEHSEINQHSSEAVHLLQIWILPKDQNTTPAYSY
ncbi:MAG: pirin family protein, partial [Cyanobacteria bacterium]|nr:pirin family protein [Cyanobacteria bacterium CG_2015-04_32_10]